MTMTVNERIDFLKETIGDVSMLMSNRNGYFKVVTEKLLSKVSFEYNLMRRETYDVDLSKQSEMFKCRVLRYIRETDFIETNRYHEKWYEVMGVIRAIILENGI